jgi:hypothetical protein
VLSSIVGGVEKLDTTLDQLKPGSDFYKLLNASDDPEVPYAVIAGNTSKIHAAAPDVAEAERALMEKLVKKLASKPTRTLIGDLVFFGSPNDTSVGLASMIGVPEGREPAPVVYELPCDHISYFNTEVGLRAIAEALA